MPSVSDQRLGPVPALEISCPEDRPRYDKQKAATLLAAADFFEVLYQAKGILIY